jgi:hypothetical protein
VLGTSCWVSDPLDPSKNATRPCYAFRSIQQLFANCLHRIETEGNACMCSYPRFASKGGPNGPHGSGGGSGGGGMYYSIPEEVDLLKVMLSGSVQY